jgi:hypothetical protein
MGGVGGVWNFETGEDPARCDGWFWNFGDRSLRFGEFETGREAPAPRVSSSHSSLAAAQAQAQQQWCRQTGESWSWAVGLDWLSLVGKSAAWVFILGWFDLGMYSGGLCIKPPSLLGCRNLSIWWFLCVFFLYRSPEQPRTGEKPMLFFFRITHYDTQNARTLIPVNKRTQTLPLRASSKTGPVKPQDWRSYTPRCRREYRLPLKPQTSLNPENFALTGSRTQDLRCYGSSCNHYPFRKNQCSSIVKKSIFWKVNIFLKSE